MLLLSVEKTYIVSQACEILFAIACAMFIVATWHFGALPLSIILIVPDNVTGAFLDDARAWHAIMRDALYITQCLLGDSVAIYRCWVLWDRDLRMVALPLVLLAASTGDIFHPAIWDRIAAFYALALGQNTITTGLMAFRLWLVDRRSMAYNVGQSHFYSTMLLLVESAALYFALQVVILASFLTKSNIQLIILGSIPPIIGTTFTLITIRVAFRSKQTTDGTTQTQTLRSLNLRAQAIRIEIPDTIDISQESSTSMSTSDSMVQKYTMTMGDSPV
ncbi:hypothetical protein C8R44DRAFT_725994 [Mycena epipterygia]|nr:hypothetical protein C8R44DRAFT_725994 [Mycena epipterygia]